MKKIVSVGLALKREIIKDNVVSYSVPEEIFVDENDIGKLVRVPFANRNLVGVIVKIFDTSEYLQLLENKTNNLVAPEKLKDIIHIFHNLPKLDQSFFELAKFTANYYHQPFGDALCMSLPPKYKSAKFDENKHLQVNNTKYLRKTTPNEKKIILNNEQQIALNKILESFTQQSPQNRSKKFLLFGITGSGKTEIYLHLIDYVIHTLKKQVLLLVPEINLTPQLEQQIFQRFFDKNNNKNNNEFAVLHSSLSPSQRDFYWRLSASGTAKIILGTRLAIFTPLPNLGCIIVDEEHDLSFRQRDNFRYSARDLAVFRANNLQIPIILGSASPSLETWYNATITKRYEILTLHKRANSKAVLPTIKIVNFDYQKNTNIDNTFEVNDINKFISPKILAKIQHRLQNQQQSLIFLNRRGYATALFCANCGWISTCQHCDTKMVLHLQEHQLRCHHCGFSQKLPSSCPKCGEQNIFHSGLGTQQLEELLKKYFPTANILRIDTDSVKNRQQWLEALENIHNAADILIGTQMLAKGHDFPNLTLVVVLGVDFGLFSGDPRSEERMFAQLLQVSGRAGRADKLGEVLIQTRFSSHHLFSYLLEHKQDYSKFADNQLKIRQKINFPPYCYQALLRADAKNMVVATNFLRDAAQFGENLSAYKNVFIYDPVPLYIAKLADVNRAQLLVESENRQLLHNFIANWIPYLDYLSAQHKSSQKLSWFIEIDPPEL